MTPVCREVQHETGPDGQTRVTGLLLSKSSQQQVVKADAYVAALDVPGEQCVSTPQLSGDVNPQLLWL